MFFVSQIFCLLVPDAYMNTPYPQIASNFCQKKETINSNVEIPIISEVTARYPQKSDIVYTLKDIIMKFPFSYNNKIKNLLDLLKCTNLELDVGPNKI